MTDSKRPQQIKEDKWAEYIRAKAGTRGDVNPAIPYIIRPRRTALLDPKPTLLWNPVLGSTRYVVSVRDRDRTIWQGETSESQLVYPGNPPLEPGGEYTLTVESDKGASSRDEELSEELLDELKFWILAPEAAERVRAEVEEAQRERTGDAETLAVARTYMQYELRAEAIALLDAAVERESQTTEIYLTLADLYVETDLGSYAESFYQEAIEMAQKAGEAEQKARAAASLGRVYAIFGNAEAAIHWLTQAKEGFEALEDTQTVEELASAIEELSA